MDDYQKKQILDKLTSTQSVLIAVSKKSSFDGVASGLALYLSLKKFGKNALIVAGEPTVDDAKKLYGVDKIGKLKGKEDLVIVVNNAINTVDRVTYNLDGEKLKIKIHTLSESEGVSQKDVSIEKAVTFPDTVIAIGFDSAQEMKSEITHEQINGSTSWILSINKKKSREKFAQIELTDIEVATLCELTTKIMTNLKLPLDEDISFNLYSGIKISTGMFSPKHTSPTSFEAAQHLIKLGAGRASLANLERSQSRPTAIDVKEKPNNSNDIKIKDEPFQQLYKPLYNDEQQTSIEEVEVEKQSKESWLKPPKVYKGSKSFDRES